MKEYQVRTGNYHFEIDGTPYMIFGEGYQVSFDQHYEYRIYLLDKVDREYKVWDSIECDNGMIDQQPTLANVLDYARSTIQEFIESPDWAMFR